MNKIAFVFPGQGAQYVGMGKEFADKYEVASKIFDDASEAIGYDMKKMCFDSSDEDLKKTENTQPSILTASYAIYKVIEEKGIIPHAVAGLSLGEYSALVASGAIDFKDGIKIVQKRGKYMQEEVPIGVGTMAAILGLENDKVAQACQMASSIGIVEPANYNCPKQLVIAGEILAVEKAVEHCRELGAKKAVMLPVSAPFHTSMLLGAGKKLGEELENIVIRKHNIPVVSNIDAKYIECHTTIKDKLIKQVSNPVQWESSIETLINDGVNIFLEIGPGNALSKFIKKISKDVLVLNVENLESFDKTMEKLESLEITMEKTNAIVA